MGVQHQFCKEVVWHYKSRLNNVSSGSQCYLGHCLYAILLCLIICINKTTLSFT